MQGYCDRLQIECRVIEIAPRWGAWLLYLGFLHVSFYFQVVITFGVGSEIHKTISNDFRYIGAPFLMGTVALGMSVCHSSGYILLHVLPTYNYAYLKFF